VGTIEPVETIEGDKLVRKKVNGPARHIDNDEQNETEDDEDGF
jgi:hypothetical protein